MLKLYDYIVEPRDQNDPMMDCMDCHYQGREYGEIDRGEPEAEVVCPKCGSYHYYYS